MNSAKVSDVLLAYYCSCSTSSTTMLSRFQKFKDLGMSKLKSEVWAFATTYKHAYAGRVAGALGGSDRAIYVVEVSQVPDGFLHTEVLTREGFLPVMEETAVLPYRVRQVSPVDDGAVIEFEVPNPDAEGPRILLQTRHYGFAAGEAR